MPELVLPGVYIEVRPEGLIVPGPVSVGNIGIVGTASRGPLNEVKVLSSYAEAREIFGPYDPYEDPARTVPALTLVRALELAYANGASTVYAVRVGSANAAPALPTGNMEGNPLIFDPVAKYPGTWANGMTINIVAAPGNKSRVTLKLGNVEEEYVVGSGTELVARLKAESALVTATADTNAANQPQPIPAPVAFGGGVNGSDAADTNYADGLRALLNQNAHIIVAAGMDHTTIGDEMQAHVDAASNDENKRDRIGVIGSRAKKPNDDASAFIAAEGKTNVSNGRIIYVAPGVKATDAAATPPREVTLPGSYAAAAVAGLLSARDPHISLTNKTLSVAGLEVEFNSGQLKQLVQGNVLALERRRGFRVVKAITTDPGPFQQITTRRIVDFAKFGVRSAAEPFIGLLNNDRVRKALKGSINGFLADMVTDEMLVSYELDVTATRDEELRGIARVTLTVRPTFSIDYIKVVMFLG